MVDWDDEENGESESNTDHVCHKIKIEHDMIDKPIKPVAMNMTSSVIIYSPAKKGTPWSLLYYCCGSI